jgi:hypothetical protein
VAKQAAEPQIILNFGYIKQVSKPGGWRRGYNYYRTGQVQHVEPTETGVLARVKGNYKDFYTTELDFRPDGLDVRCDCPLEETWCKHAVAVALVSIEEHAWERFWGMPVRSDAHAMEYFEGNYQFILETKLRPKTLSLKMIDRRTLQAVGAIEPVLRAAVTLQGSGQATFSDIEKREFAILQYLLKQNYAKPEPDGWFHVGVVDAEPLFNLLAVVEELLAPDGTPIFFEPNTLELMMSVNVSLAGNVLVSLHWTQKDPYDAFPLEEVEMLSREIRWGRRKNRFFPLAGKLSVLPKYLTKSSFTDIRDADGGKFMYEELPRLRKMVTIDEADIIEQLRLEKRPPRKVLSLEMVDSATLRLRATLSFSYDGVEVAYSRSTPETPYVMVVRKETETIYWVRRDLKVEQAAYQHLSEGGLEPMQANFFQSEGDDAIDFYNLTLPQLGQDWEVKVQGDANAINLLAASPWPLTIRADLDFSEHVVDQFILSIASVVGPYELDMDEVQAHLMQGKKYFFYEGAGFVEIPLAAILQFGKTLQAFDAEQFGTDRYLIRTFKAGLIGELVDQGVVLRMSPKFEKFWEVITSGGKMEELPVPRNVKAELRGYQVRGFNWLWFLYTYGLNGILADDMGLGKTLQALTLLQHAKNVEGRMPSLIVCPTSIVFNWENEIRRFTPDMKIINLTGPARFDRYKEIADADIVLTSYAILRRDINALKNYPFRLAILDESQNIKNPESQTAQAAKLLQADHRLALSGTPIENRLSELWSVFDFLMPTFLYDAEMFRHKYVLPIEEKGNRDAERRLKKQVFPFILRRMKRDVVQDLPPKSEFVAYCTLTDEQQELYMKILDETREQVFAQVAEKGINASQKSIFAALLRLRQICCHPSLMGEELSAGIEESGKFEMLQTMLEDVIANGHRILLFSQFVEMLKIVRTWLDRKGIKYEYLTGQTKDRQGAVERFNRDESIPIFLISLKAGGTGLNLTGADYVIHYDPWWNPAAEDQATDRAHRIGQTKNVFVYRLITRGTVEEKIVKLQDRKRDLVDSIIAADRSMGKLLSFEDLKEILSPDF